MRRATNPYSYISAYLKGQVDAQGNSCQNTCTLQDSNGGLQGKSTDLTPVLRRPHSLTSEKRIFPCLVRCCGHDVVKLCIAPHREETEIAAVGVCEETPAGSHR